MPLELPLELPCQGAAEDSTGKAER